VCWNVYARRELIDIASNIYDSYIVLRYTAVLRYTETLLIFR
jgi:hypothetical protein